MIALTGTGRLADDIYLLAHHEVSGRPFLQPRATGLGLAGGLLAELALIGAVRVAGESIAATDRVHPQDGLTRAVQVQVLRERPRPRAHGLAGRGCWPTGRQERAGNLPNGSGT